MYKIILGIFILCYGLYNAYNGNYSDSYSLIESIGSSFFLIVVGWVLFWSGLNKNKIRNFPLLSSRYRDLNLKTSFNKINFKIIFLILIGLSLFYWFQYRPSVIRKACYLEVMKSPGYFETRIYQGCLNSKGITN